MEGMVTYNQGADPKPVFLLKDCVEAAPYFSSKIQLGLRPHLDRPNTHQ